MARLLNQYLYFNTSRMKINVVMLAPTIVLPQNAESNVPCLFINGGKYIHMYMLLSVIYVCIYKHIPTHTYTYILR